jgi:hypothetical protein
MLMRAEPAAATIRAHGAENTTPRELAMRNEFLDAAQILAEMEQGVAPNTFSIAVCVQYSHPLIDL